MVVEKDFVFVVEDEEIQSYREQYAVPAFCKFCRNLMENWDSNYWYKFGTCSNCYVNFLADRQLPDGLLSNRKLIGEFIKEEIKKQTK